MKFFYQVRVKRVRVYHGVVEVSLEIDLQTNSYSVAKRYADLRQKASNLPHYVTFSDGTEVIPV